MSPRRSHAPRASLRHHRGRWRVYWKHDYKTYEAAILDDDCDTRRAEAILAQANAALAGRADWPAEIAAAPAVARYLDAVTPPSPHALSGAPTAYILERYRQFLAGGRASAEWVDQVMRWIGGMLDAVDGLDGMDAARVAAWLDGRTVGDPPRPVAAETRNKIRTQIRKFCKWVRDQKAKPADWTPEAGLAKARVSRKAGGIQVLDDDEVELVLAAADQVGVDGLAVWIALLGGVRRGEIPPLKWTNITERIIVIEKSKNGDGRDAPLSKRLAARLARANRSGEKILSWPVNRRGWIARARRLLEEKLPTILDPKPPKKHAKKDSQAASAWAGRSKQAKPFPVELLEWNVLRHTYASRLVRRGVPLDMVADWMGNSPEVCRRHYARFLPREGRDNRIDLVDG